jgi:DNA primase small subunit
MPHSVSSETSPRLEEEDGVLPDAPSDAADTPAQTDDQSSTEKDDESQKEIEKIKQEVKLEDLFNDDDDDDDEFATPGSTPDSKMEVDSSPPEAPQYAPPTLLQSIDRLLILVQAKRQVLRPRDYVRLLPTIIPFPISIPMAQSRRETRPRFRTS